MIPGTPRSPTGTDCHEETNWQRLTHALTSTLSTAGDRRLQLIKASLTSGSVAKWGKQEMPPQGHLQEPDRDLLARWVLGLHQSGRSRRETPGRFDRVNPD